MKPLWVFTVPFDETKNNKTVFNNKSNNNLLIKIYQNELF